MGDRTTLNQLYKALREALQAENFDVALLPRYQDFRGGDVRHSQADIGKAHSLLGYAPSHAIKDGINEAVAWYIKSQKVV